MGEPDGRGVRWETQEGLAPTEPIGDIPNFHPPPVEREDRVELPNIEGYSADEGELFNFLAADRGTGTAPYPYWDVTAGSGYALGTQSVRSAAWTCIYLYSLISENKRPLVWIARAKVKLRELADFLLQRQAGSASESADLVGLIGSTATTDLEYGAFLDPTGGASTIATGYTEDVGSGGLALLRAYQVLGDVKYRNGYLAAAKCLRRMQCGGKLTSGFSASDSSGTGAYNPGTFIHKLSVTDPYGLGGGGGGGTPTYAAGLYLTDTDGWHTVRSVQPINVDPSNYGTAPLALWVLNFDEFPYTNMQVAVGGTIYDNGFDTALDLEWRLAYGRSNVTGGAYSSINDTDRRLWTRTHRAGQTATFYDLGTAITKPSGTWSLMLYMYNNKSVTFRTYYFGGPMLSVRFW